MTEGLIPGELRVFLRRRGISIEIAALLMIVFGVLIIIIPDLVALLVGSYLVVAGLITLVGHIGRPGR
ncbi:MAG: hypothetical protein ACE5IB_04825, partial [Candidatus Geothermarchaeales archaeon]